MNFEEIILEPEDARRRNQVEMKAMIGQIGASKVAIVFDSIADMDTEQSETPLHPRYFERYGVNEDEA